MRPHGADINDLNVGEHLRKDCWATANLRGIDRGSAESHLNEHTTATPLRQICVAFELAYIGAGLIDDDLLRVRLRMLENVMFISLMNDFSSFEECFFVLDTCQMVFLLKIR